MPRRQITYSNHPNHRARAVHAQGERQFKTYDTSHIRPRKSKVPYAVGAIIAIVVLAIAAFAATSLLRGCSAEAEDIDGSQVAVAADVKVTIPDGSTASNTAKLLESSGVVPDADEFLAYAKGAGLDSRFKSGVYTFTAGMTLEQVAKTIVSGASSADTLTIPEGYTVAQIASAVEKSTSGSISADDFTKQAVASNYVSDYPFLSDAYDDSLEGFLFPKTYDLSGAKTADDVIRMMLDQYATEVASLDYSYPTSKGLSAYQVLVMASVIEKEAAPDANHPDERAQVSSVFYNRLAADMALQSDATMGYVTGGEVTPEDLQTESPYNTYLNKGLPAGPICNPSIESLKAACNPATTDYLYFFIVNETGYSDHAFSKTLDEHNAAIAKYQEYTASKTS